MIFFFTHKALQENQAPTAGGGSDKLRTRYFFPNDECRKAFPRTPRVLPLLLLG